MALEFTDQNIQDVIASGNPVVVDFWAEWCGPCRIIGPSIEELSLEYKGRVEIGKVNVDDNPEAASMFGIRNIPTVLFFKNGQVVDKQIGAVAKAQLAAKVEALL